MVNASLNWASIVGIVLAVCGAGLYFLRSFKPALARDYDVFFAAIGLLCGGILFFQGWRLDPILQFGQFLLAGTTVFFAYESVRLRGIATDQARRSSYFDENPEPGRFGSGTTRRGWDDAYDQFDESPLPRRRFDGGEYSLEEESGDVYSQRRISRRAIPESAESRRTAKNINSDSWDQKSTSERRMARFGNSNQELDQASDFGQRRNFRQEQRRGSRPISNKETSNTRRLNNDDLKYSSSSRPKTSSQNLRSSDQSVMGRKTEDAAFYPSSRNKRSNTSRNNNLDALNAKEDKFRSRPSSSSSRPSPRRGARIRDNSSRFDD